MKYLRKIKNGSFAALIGLVALTSCEGSDLYNVLSPDWLSEKIDSIAAANKQGELEGMMEDVYTIGKTDYSSGWWGAFSKYYVVPAGQVWYAQFNLNINPEASAVYKNFALVFTNDNYEVRNGDGYAEYGVIRFDNRPDPGNSEWGEYIDRGLVTSTLTFGTDTDEGIEKLGGKVTLTVDRTDGGLTVIMDNGTVTKTYKQTTPWPDAATASENIRCFLVPEGSYIDFLATNIEPIGGCTSAEDKQPVSMTLENVPDEITLGADLSEALADMTATVTYEEGVTATVRASDLIFDAYPDLTTPGEKTLTVMYNKTFKGEIAEKPIVAYSPFKVMLKVTALEVTAQPTRSTYYFYTSEATSGMNGRTLAFDPTGLVVTATYSDGSSAVVDNDKLTFSAVPASVGSHTVTITGSDEQTTSVTVNVATSTVETPTLTPTTVGPTDNSAGWWTYFSNDVKVDAGKTMKVNFINYAGGANWNNWLVILRQASGTEYGVFRADNWAWRYDINPVPGTVYSGGQTSWETWLAAMSGAHCTAYITNCNNGRADIQMVMNGTDGKKYYQYYLGTSDIIVDDLQFAFTVDGCHIVFE